VVIDDAFTSARRKKMTFLGDVQPFAEHAKRLVQCKGELESLGCRDEAELERWERNIRNITHTAESAWRSLTGLGRNSGGEFYPASDLAFSGTIPPHQTEYLSFEFDPRQVTAANVALLVGERSATLVKNPSDLQRSTVWIAVRYYPIRTVTFGGLAFIFVLMVRFIARQSTKNLSRYELANVALAVAPGKNESVWSELYNRVRPYIVSDYRHSCQIFGKTGDLSPFELFDHIRNRLIIDHGIDPAPFPDERRFEERLHGYIREIAALS
jgi:hypothetical protein